MGYEKNSLFVLIISLYWSKKIFKRAHQNPNTNVWAHQEATFWAVRYIPPPPPPRVPSSLSYILC